MLMHPRIQVQEEIKANPPDINPKSSQILRASHTKAREPAKPSQASQASPGPRARRQGLPPLAWAPLLRSSTLDLGLRTDPAHPPWSP